MSQRQLIILRHAKSAWNDPGARDHERPLNARGLDDAPRMGRWLADAGWRPDYCLASTARRAQQTLALAAAEFDDCEVTLHAEPAIYEASLDTLLEVLAGCPGDAARVLLVGHNPGLESLLLYLLDTPPAAGNPLPTATAAVIALPDDWSRLPAGVGRCLAYQRPREL